MEINFKGVLMTTDNSNVLFTLDTLSLQLDNAFHASAARVDAIGEKLDNLFRANSFEEMDIDSLGQKLNDLFHTAGVVKYTHNVSKAGVELLGPDYPIQPLLMINITPLKDPKRPASNTGPDLSL